MCGESCAAGTVQRILGYLLQILWFRILCMRLHGKLTSARTWYFRPASYPAVELCVCRAAAKGGCAVSSPPNCLGTLRESEGVEDYLVSQRLQILGMPRPINCT